MTLRSGVFPDLLKKGFVTPVVQKSTHDPDILKNNKPVSNIPFIANVIKSVVASKFRDFLSNHELMRPYSLHIVKVTVLKRHC